MAEDYRVDGRILWRETAGSQPQWIDGPVYIEDGVFRRQSSRRAHVSIKGWAVPGLADVHCHIGLVSSGPASDEETRAQAARDLASGVTLVRDCGVPRDTSFLDSGVDEGAAVRPIVPTILRCGQHLARPKRYIRNFARELDSSADLPRAMVEECRRGSGWVKLVGDWIDRCDGAESTLQPLWDRQALIDGVQAVHENGGRVTVHTFSHRALDDLLEAGVDCLEHATGADSSHIDHIARTGIPVTPTLLQVDLFDSFAEAGGAKYPAYAAQMHEMFERREEHFARMWQQGVIFVPGTDSGGYQKHGSLPRELQQWLRFGASPAQVIDSATWRVRDFLGQPVIEEGAAADCVIYEDDPTAAPTSDNPLGGLKTLASPIAIFCKGMRVAAFDA